MKRSHSMFAEFWREYGKLDARWVDFDTCIVRCDCCAARAVAWCAI
jgi:hypothetical protein